MTEQIPQPRTVLGRGLRRRCPRCGQGPVYQRWVKMHDHCGDCGLKYLQDEGDLWVYLVATDRALFILPLIVMIYFQLYNPNSVWFFAFGAALLFGFIYTLPHRNGLALGLDYLIRCKWGDLSQEALAAKPDDAPPK